MYDVVYGVKGRRRGVVRRVGGMAVCMMWRRGGEEWCDMLEEWQCGGEEWCDMLEEWWCGGEEWCDLLEEEEKSGVTCWKNGSVWLCYDVAERRRSGVV